MHPLDNSLPEVSDVPTGAPNIMPYKHSHRPDLGAVYIYDLHIAQDRGLTFYQTGSFAIILYNTIPRDAWVKVMKFIRNNLESDILFEKRPTQGTEVTRTYSSIGTDEDPVQPHTESARRGPMRSYVEPERRNPLRDDSGPDRKTRTLTLTHLVQGRSFVRPKA